MKLEKFRHKKLEELRQEVGWRSSGKKVEKFRQKVGEDQARSWRSTGKKLEKFRQEV